MGNRRCASNGVTQANVTAKTTALASTTILMIRRVRKARERAEASLAADPTRPIVRVKERIKADVEADPRRQARKSFQIRHYCAKPI